MRRSFLTAAAIAGLPLSLGAGPYAVAQTMPAPATSQTAPMAPAAPMGGHHGGMMQGMKAKFDAANTTHDGHLTLAQAQAGNLKIVAANFQAIDLKNRGYITFNDVMAWRLEQLAQKLQQRAAELRAQD